MYRSRILAGFALGLVLSVAAHGDAKSIKQAKLPPAVLKTAEQNVGGATVTGYTVDKVDGASIYRMDLVADGLTRAVVMDQDGGVLSTEQEIPWNDLPASIQKNFEGVSSKGKLGAVSSVSEGGKIVAYEAYLTVKGERAKVRVKPKAE